MLVDLVRTTTRDGLRLDGTWQAPSVSGQSQVPVDAFCLVHGTGGSFYSSTLFDRLAERLLELGCGVLRINTRGHDGVSTASVGMTGRRQGAAYEVVDDCRHDVAAWVDWLRQKGAGRVGLVGHSLGAVKVLYAAANEPDLNAACVIALSPPRLSYSWFRASSAGPQFLETIALAERHVQNGQPAALLDVTLPLPFLITAAGYLEKYGPDERYNFLQFTGAVPAPLLFTFGSREVDNNVAFRGAPEALAPLPSPQSRLEVETIAGADHFYTGVTDALVQCVEVWLHRANR